jgi:hypothetical protein|tara:strand:- start:257 stop:463 length:207 start_codon:yes stop_codon:yes gene_type:complete
MKDKYGYSAREPSVQVHMMPSVVVCEVILPVVLDLKTGEASGLKQKIHDALHVALNEHFEESLGGEER